MTIRSYHRAITDPRWPCSVPKASSAPLRPTPSDGHMATPPDADQRTERKRLRINQKRVRHTHQCFRRNSEAIVDPSVNPYATTVPVRHVEDRLGPLRGQPILTHHRPPVLSSVLSSCVKPYAINVYSANEVTRPPAARVRGHIVRNLLGLRINTVEAVCSRGLAIYNPCVTI